MNFFVRHDLECWDPESGDIVCDREYEDLEVLYKEVGSQSSTRDHRSQIDSCSRESRLVNFPAKVSWVGDKTGKRKLLKEKDLPIITNRSCKRRVFR